MASLPFTPENVLYMIEGNYITAVWTSDPDLAAQGATAVFDRRFDRSVVVVHLAEAVLNRKSNGSPFSGWMLFGPGAPSAPVRRKGDARATMRQMVAAHMEGYAARCAAKREAEAVEAGRSAV